MNYSPSNEEYFEKRDQFVLLQHDLTRAGDIDGAATVREKALIYEATYGPRKGEYLADPEEEVQDD